MLGVEQCMYVDVKNTFYHSQELFIYSSPAHTKDYYICIQDYVYIYIYIYIYMNILSIFIYSSPVHVMLCTTIVTTERMS